MYTQRRGLGAVPAGSVLSVWQQSAGGGNPLQGAGSIQRLMAAIQEAMAGDDLKSAITLQSSLSVFTDGAPGEPDARSQGFGPGVIDKLYMTVSAWANTRRDLWNQQFGPGYSTVTGGTNTGISPEQATQQIEQQQAQFRAQQLAASDTYREQVRRGLQARGVDATTIAQEISRLNALFGEIWPDLATAWPQVSSALRSIPIGNGNVIAPENASMAPLDPNGRYIIDGRVIDHGQDVGPAPSVTGGGGNEIADESNTVNGAPQQAGLGMIAGIILLGALVGQWLKGKSRGA